jgi:triosephosphate isomerase
VRVSLPGIFLGGNFRDGALVGGASLKPDFFTAIVKYKLLLSKLH